MLVLALADATRDRLRDISLIVAAIVGSAAVLKLAWHPRSWIRRFPTWVFVRLIIDPGATRATAFLEQLIDRVVTPQFAAVREELQALSDRNDEQHAANVDRIEQLASAQSGLTATIVETNARLTSITETILTTPGFPTITGEVPTTTKESA